jgi:hypothetical protein
VGIETKYTAVITKTCDGCGARWEARQVFSHVASVLAFGGPVEAAAWEIHMTPEGAHLLCELCAVHKKGATDGRTD